MIQNCTCKYGKTDLSTEDGQKNVEVVSCEEILRLRCQRRHQRRGTVKVRRQETRVRTTLQVNIAACDERSPTGRQGEIYSNHPKADL